MIYKWDKFSKLKKGESMQVELLREIFDDVINEENESNRIGCLWVHEDAYEQCLPLLKMILLDSNIKRVTCEDCIIERKEGGFEIKDFHGGTDFYSYDDAVFLVDLWEKVLKNPYNCVVYDEETKQYTNFLVTP